MDSLDRPRSVRSRLWLDHMDKNVFCLILQSYSEWNICLEANALWYAHVPFVNAVVCEASSLQSWAVEDFVMNYGIEVKIFIHWGHGVKSFFFFNEYFNCDGRVTGETSPCLGDPLDLLHEYILTCVVYVVKHERSIAGKVMKGSSRCCML